jgi:hypothetical protein
VKCRHIDKEFIDQDGRSSIVDTYGVAKGIGMCKMAKYWSVSAVSSLAECRVLVDEYR